MNHKNLIGGKSIFQKFFLVLLLILFLSFVSGEVLVTTYVEKNEIYPYEMNNLVIKILNNSPTVLDKFYLRIQGDDSVVFVEEGVEKKNLSKEILELESNITKEIKIKFKTIVVKKEPSALFVYYGFENDYSKGVLPFVSGTIVNTKENKVNITTKVEKTSSLSGEEINGSISISNKTGSIITRLASEMIVPDGFDLKSEPFFVEVIDSNIVSTKFNALAPINVDGEQIVLIVYGYFDENGVGHYFEKEHKVSFVKTNRSFLALIGIIVLIIAVFLYLQRTKKDDKLKGSGDKK